METTLTSSAKEVLLKAIGQSSVSSLEHINEGAVKSARKSIETLEFPTTRVEDWKYTRTARLTSEPWKIQRGTSSPDIAPFLIEGLNATVVVFVNGFFREEMSTALSSDQITLIPFGKLSGDNLKRASEIIDSEATSVPSIFSALNTAWCTDGLFFVAKKNTVVTNSLHFLFLQEGEHTLAQPRIAGIVESGADLHIVATYATLDKKKAWTNAVVEVAVEENASLTYDKIQQEGDSNFCLINEHFRQQKDSRFSISTLTVDGGWVRNNLNIRLDGTNCESHLNGFYLPRRQQHIDNHTLVDHLLPHSTSNELYKGVLYDKGRAVFNGKVFVRPDAQKTNAFQTNANIMMSDDATVNTKPELEIYADDVKCSHGTTTGQFDEPALFYLRARGLSEDSAKMMLTAAFINDVLNKVDNESVRNYVQNALVEKNLLV